MFRYQKLENIIFHDQITPNGLPIFCMSKYKSLFRIVVIFKGLYVIINITENLWRRKCVRRAIFWNVEETTSPLLCLQHGHWTLCDLSAVILQQKNIPVLSEIRCWIFFYSTIFSERSCNFRENLEKLFWGRIWQFFTERRRFGGFEYFII